MLLTEFTVNMFIKSSHGDLKTALDIADKTERFYEQHKNKNSIAKSRYLSASKCFFELFDMVSKEQTNDYRKIS